MRQIPYLEKGIKTNLGKISFIGKTVRNNCLKGKLKESFASYKSWGKGAKVTLRFCKSGNQNIEKAYATHYCKRKTVDSQGAPTAFNTELNRYDAKRLQKL